MKKTHEVARSLVMMGQVGIVILVPMFLGLALGLWLDGRFQTAFTIPLFLLGLLGGVRGSYVLVQKELARQSRETEQEPVYDLMKGWEDEADEENLS